MQFDPKTFLDSEEIKKLLQKSDCEYLENILKGDSLPINEDDIKSIIRLSFILTNYAFGKIKEQQVISDDTKGFLNIAYKLLISIPINTEINKSIFDEIWGIKNIQQEEVYYFYIAVLGLLSEENFIRVQIDLRKYVYTPENFQNYDWQGRVIHRCLSALILLIRKDDGIEDVKLALNSIEALKQEQSEFEDQYLESLEIKNKIEKAYNILGFYHLGKVVVETAKYLIEGYSYEGNLQKQIQRHSQLATDCLPNEPRLTSLVFIFEVVTRNLQLNSIWFQTDALGSDIQKFCKQLGQQKIIDLLPSQKKALRKNLLDPASNVVVVQMPTSAGKTLLAEFQILQTRALKSNAKILYIVPTRALVNQILNDFKEDFKNFNLVIEKTSKVNEVDPSENLFLQENIDILISTPEKADLLIRRNHPFFEDISLVIVDEAHNIKDGVRGARLELLLAILKREKPKAKFMLLSPFLPNSEQLTDWLAGGRNAVPPIQIDWKPAEKLIMGIKKFRKNKKDKFQLQILPSAHNQKIKEEYNICIENTQDLITSGAKENLFEFTARHFSEDKKSILYLCWGKKTADNHALVLADIIKDEQSSELRNLVSKYIEEEVGQETTLSKVLKKGIAVHHAGLTDETRQLIEFLIRKKEINHICATTTVAQGINFPISTVYIGDTRVGSTGKRLSIGDFLNIAGRAGRTLVDSVGKIIFPFNTQESQIVAKGYMQNEAEQITSALLELLGSSEKIMKAFSLDTFEDSQVESRRELFSSNESLSSLIQYIIHLLNISREDAYAEELEDLFKDTFGYFLLDNEQKLRFVDICKSLYLNLESKFNKGTLKFADKTGFSVPSVLKIMDANKQNPEIADPLTWEPKNLFREGSDYLAKKISVIGKLREVDLGSNSRESPFNPAIVAKVLIGWVNGEKLNVLANEHPFFSQKDDEDKINDFVSYLTGATFKSSWGLSALEGIVKSKGDDLEENSHIPSMVFFGVKTKEAVAMRMLGVPRNIATSLSSHLYSGSEEPKSYQDVRDDIENLSNSDWNKIVPENSKLSGAEWKTINQILTS